MIKSRIWCVGASGKGIFLIAAVFIMETKQNHIDMKKLLSTLFLLVALFGALDATAQIKDGSATVKQGNTVTVSISSAYVTTLTRATNVSATWSAGSSAITVMSHTNSSCTIKGNTPGTARLNYRCTYRYDGYARSMNFYYDITITSATVQVTNITISHSNAILETGATLQLEATAYPMNATNRGIRWSTEDSHVATVNSDGLVTAHNAGRVWIWARAADGSGCGKYCVVDVTEPEPDPEPETVWLSVILPNGSLAIDVTGLETLRLKISPDPGYELHSVTVDGVTQSVDAENDILLLPAPAENAELNAVFQQAGITETDDFTSDNVEIKVSGRQVNIRGMKAGDRATIYTLAGMQVCTAANETFELAEGVYVILAGQRTFKIATGR